MTARTSISHNSGRRPAVARKRPRNAEPSRHADKYAAETPETSIERAVREAVAAAPPLSDETREQVARLLTKGVGR